MRIQEGAVLETLRRIQRFLDDQGAVLEALNRSRARKRLDEAADQMAGHAVAQIGGRRMAEGETARQRVLRAELRYDHMQPIAIIAGQQLRERPEFKLLRLPRWKVRGAGLIVAARDMANAAERYSSLFVEEGLAPDFVAELRSVADRLEQSVTARGESQGQRAGATAGLKAEARRARGCIRLLDSLVRRTLGKSEELLREWEVASNVQRHRRSVSAASAHDTSAAPALSLVPAATASSPSPGPGSVAA